MENLIKTASDEKYYNKAKAEFEALRKSLSHNIDTDFYEHKNEISDLLKQEIIGRYYYQVGRIVSSFEANSVLYIAKKILENPNEYAGILSGEETVSKKNMTTGKKP